MIPAPTVEEPVAAFRRIVAAWREQHKKRAYGGLWALSGFSFQTGVYLLNFYRNLAQERPLPSIEELSDIVCPADSKISAIIQVKRTLTRETLKQAIEEFALIIRLIQDRNEVALLDSLRFQVTCRSRESNVAWPVPAEATLPDDIRGMLHEVEAQQANPFIIELADPLEDLWALLWAKGVRDPLAIIRYAAGRLLDSFGQADSAPAIHRDLISSFESAPRRAEGPRVGALLLADDVTPDSDAQFSAKVVVGGGFGFSEVREGCFRPRPIIFRRSWAEFEKWFSQSEARFLEREIPVFWIDGRSGEGKSVLLRQLVAHILLQHPDRLPIFEVHREDLPLALKERREIDHPALLVTDDPYAIRNRESWDDNLSHAVETDLPRVCVLACGPTEQREEFERRFTQPFQVTRFTIPPFEEAERQEFVDWFTRRTGRTQRHGTRITENALLVQVMFELCEGMTLAEFARRFRRRLELSGALAAVQRILSLSALYLETPLDLLAQTDERDTISRLSKDDQRHFQLEADSVTFAHAHLAGEILRPILETSYPRISWNIAWARELSVVFALPPDRLPAYTQENILRQLTLTPRLTSAERVEALEELYESHLAANGGKPMRRLLPNWFNAMLREPDINLKLSPVDYAISAISSPEEFEHLPPQVASGIWKLADKTQLTADLDQACWHFLLLAAGRYSHGPTAVINFLRISSQPSVYRSRSFEWLDKNPEHAQAYHLLAPLVAGAPTDAEVRSRAVKWLDDNPEHPQDYWLLAPMVAAAPTDVEIRSRAVKWLDNNLEHPQIVELLRAMVAGAPTDLEIRSRAMTWLDNNSEHPQAHHLLAALVAGWPTDLEIRSRAVTWLGHNLEHPHAPTDVEIRSRAVADSTTTRSIRRRISCSVPWWPVGPMTLKSAPVQ